MKPKNLTHAEVGFFLQAVGRQMVEHDLCFSAVVEDGFSHQEVFDNLLELLDTPLGVSSRRAAALMLLDGEDCINFNSVEDA